MVGRGDRYYCGRCAVRADWEAVARMAQGLVVRAAVTADLPAASAPGPDAGHLPPADPFAH